MAIKNKDFIEMDFIARVKETDNVFDTTVFEEAEKAGLLQGNEKGKFAPIKICVGQGMVLAGLDKAIEGKETGKWHESELQPKEAFGERDPKLVKIVSVKSFMERGIEPAAGMMLTLDNLLVRISSVSGGRVIVDFNNPLTGKNIIYKFRINKTIEDLKEKVSALSEFFIGKPEKISVEATKAILEFKMKLPEYIAKELSKKIKEILDLDLKIKETEAAETKKEKKEEKTIETKKDKKEEIKE